MTQHLEPGTRIASRRLSTASGEQLAVPHATQLVHLQFRRFAGCPVCHLHLREVIRRAREIEAAGIIDVVFFHSSVGELREYAAELPRYVVADPELQWYREFGVESGARALLDPRAYGPILRAVFQTSLRVARGRDKLRFPRAENGRLGLPADFLIAPDQQLMAAKYGRHADDQWSVDELLALAAGHREQHSQSDVSLTEK
jgi:hypothetical protein